MTVLNFPSSPADGDTFTENNITYTFVENGANPGFWSASGEEINLQSVTDNGNITDTRVGINATDTTAPIDSLCLPYIDTDDEERGIAWQRGAIDSARIVVHCEDTGFSRAASLRFKTMTANSAAADRFIIEDAGDVNIVDGNLIVADGHGIVFGTQPAASGNRTPTGVTLADFETGTWNPALVSGTNGITNSSQFGNYTKIGQAVIISCELTARMDNISSPNAQCTISLPFPIAAEDRGVTAMLVFNGGASWETFFNMYTDKATALATPFTNVAVGLANTGFWPAATFVTLSFNLAYTTNA
jgi:hypothetical protein